MKKLYTILFFAIVFVACQKEYDPGPIPVETGTDSTSTNPIDTTQTQADLKGTWYLVSMTGQSQSTVDLTFDGTDERTISFFDYTTTNNNGTIVFSDSTMSSNNISYSVKDTMKSFVYENTTLTDSIEFPLAYTIPASSTTSDYKLIGSDSIYISNSFLSVPGSDTTTAAVASGGKYTINGNILTLTQSLDTAFVTIESGLTYNKHDQGTFISTFKKQ